jgi:hypothetical protein
MERFGGRPWLFGWLLKVVRSGREEEREFFFFFFFKKRKRKKGYYVRIAVSQRIYLTQGWPLQTFFFLFLFGFLFLLMGFLRCCPIKR